MARKRKRRGAGTAAPAGRAAILQARSLRRSYGELVALDSLTFALEPGRLVALVGHNGAGKSTFLSLAAGLLEPSGGDVRISGEPAGSQRARAATSFLPDTPVLYDDLSIAEHLEYVARLHGIETWSERAGELLERLGLGDRGDRLSSELSRGMRQKASIALALIRPFDVLLADEPFDALDPASREALGELLAEASAGGAAVVVSTHRSEVLERADRCLALTDGRLSYDGAADPDRLAELLP